MPTQVSHALTDFEQSLTMVQALLDLEGKLPRGGRRANLHVVQGIRGGTAVLMVAAFENFIRQLVQEHLDTIAAVTRKIKYDRLPEPMRVHYAYLSLDWATRGRPRQRGGPRSARLPEVERVCAMIVGKQIDPEVFSDTGGNPNEKTVKEMFENLGIRDIYAEIKPGFEKRRHTKTSPSLIAAKLEEIVARRHRVAHTANALNVSRADLKGDIRFLKALGQEMDKYLQGYVQHLLQQAAP